MCFDEKTSWITFIIGTIGNIWFISKGVNDRIRIGLFVLWQSVLFVQLLEALLWRTLNSVDSSSSYDIQKQTVQYEKCKSISRYLLALLMAHPIIFILACSYTSEKYGFGIILAIMYGLYAIYATTFTTSKCMSPTSECPHITYDFLNEAPYRGTMYLVFSGLAMLACLHEKVSLPITGFIGLTFLMSNKLYPCASPSMWCWFSALAPFFTMAIY